MTVTAWLLNIRSSTKGVLKTHISRCCWSLHATVVCAQIMVDWQKFTHLENTHVAVHACFGERNMYHMQKPPIRWNFSFWFAKPIHTTRKRCPLRTALETHISRYTLGSSSWSPRGWSPRELRTGRFSGWWSPRFRPSWTTRQVKLLSCALFSRMLNFEHLRWSVRTFLMKKLFWREHEFMRPEHGCMLVIHILNSWNETWKRSKVFGSSSFRLEVSVYLLKQRNKELEISSRDKRGEGGEARTIVGISSSTCEPNSTPQVQYFLFAIGMIKTYFGNLSPSARARLISQSRGQRTNMSLSRSAWALTRSSFFDASQ